MKKKVVRKLAEKWVIWGEKKLRVPLRERQKKSLFLVRSEKKVCTGEKNIAPPHVSSGPSLTARLSNASGSFNLGLARLVVIWLTSQFMGCFLSWRQARYSAHSPFTSSTLIHNQRRPLSRALTQALVSVYTSDVNHRLAPTSLGIADKITSVLPILQLALTLRYPPPHTHYALKGQAPPPPWQDTMPYNCARPALLSVSQGSSSFLAPSYRRGTEPTIYTVKDCNLTYIASNTQLWNHVKGSKRIEKSCIWFDTNHRNLSLEKKSVFKVDRQKPRL